MLRNDENVGKTDGKMDLGKPSMSPLFPPRNVLQEHDNFYCTLVLKFENEGCGIIQELEASRVLKLPQPAKKMTQTGK